MNLSDDIFKSEKKGFHGIEMLMLKDVLTAQEHKLIGSTVEQRHYEQPYKPLGVIDEKFSVEECSRARLDRGTLHGILAGFYGADGLGYATLEPLDTDPNSINYGSTVRDPVLIAADRPDAHGNHEEEFPFKRNGSQIRLEDKSSVS